MKILVTGGCGFIGSHLTERFVQDGHNVIVLDNQSTGNHLVKGANYIVYNAEDWDTDDHFDVIYHHAALARIQPSLTDPRSTHEANLTSTLNMLLLAAHCKAKFIFASSSSIFGDVKVIPTPEDAPLDLKSPYSAQKAMSEIYCKLFARMHGLDITIFRYFNVYGERQIEEGKYATVIGIFFKQLRENKPFTIVGDGEQRRDFTYVGDVVEANIKALSLKGFNVFNIGTGTNYSINEVADLISKAHPKVYLPERNGEYPITCADNFKARFSLGWEPKMSLALWLQKYGIQKNP